MRSFAVVALLGAATCWLQAQTPRPAGSAATPPQYPVVTLKFGEPQTTPLGKKGTAMLDNSTCAPDGSLFLEIADSPAEMNFVVHSLTDGSEDVRFAASVVPGYREVTWPVHYFVGDDSVVTLVRAAPLRNPMAEREKTERAMLALVYDRKGTLEHVVPIPQDIDAKSIGMYGSGDLLLVTKDPVRKRLRLLVLDKGGDIKNELSLFDHDYDAGQKATRKKQPVAKVMDAADFIQIIPDGDDLLLVPQGTQATVIEVNEHGIVRATDLQLPPGYLIRSFLSINGAYWTVSTYTHAKITYNKTLGRGLASFYDGPLFQFNSLDGSLVRRIDAPEKSTADVRCAHDGDFTALTTDKETGRLEELTGSVPR